MERTPVATPLAERRELPRRESLKLQDAEGTTVWAESGCLWLTLENDPRDIMLVRGMSFRIDRPGLTIIAAEEDSSFFLFTPPGWRERLGGWLDRQRSRAAARRQSPGAGRALLPDRPRAH